MLRAIIGLEKNVLSKCTTKEWVGVNSAICQLIRWKRKPMWLPPAKSKLFRVKPRLRLLPTEADEIIRLFNNYRTQCKAIKQYLEEIYENNQEQFDEEVLRKEEEDDFECCMKLNDEWNKEVGRSREQRVERQLEERKLLTLQNVENRQLRKQKLKETYDEKIKQAKIDSATFITRDNIDKAIEEALANIQNYNSAIDLKGNVYHSLDTKEVKSTQSLKQ